jgi:hypothetical protein
MVTQNPTIKVNFRSAIRQESADPFAEMNPAAALCYWMNTQ